MTPPAPRVSHPATVNDPETFRLLHLPDLSRCARVLALIVLGGFSPAGILPARAAEETVAEIRQRFMAAMPGVWEALPPGGTPLQSAFLDLHPDRSGTMVILLKLPTGVKTIVSQVEWKVEAGALPAESVLRLHILSSTEAALAPQPTTETTILDANRLTLRLQTLRNEPQNYVRRDKLPPEITALVAKANLSVSPTTTQNPK